MDELSEERIFGSSLHPNNAVMHNTIDEMREVHPYIVLFSATSISSYFLYEEIK